jgi:hypothetical protein
MRESALLSMVQYLDSNFCLFVPPFIKGGRRGDLAKGGKTGAVVLRCRDGVWQSPMTKLCGL